ncbi:unnamed protein product [Anisakis simplex]|uniref:RWD domain-containing protein n=1 Tax=Anisakis simplex TaxID=6269 RepID=A0A0M3IY54_ANISI|nr:unnamed protein product [Anisakis simplex]
MASFTNGPVTDGLWVMMAQEETQKEELEALEAIYPGEIEVENREYPNVTFKINLRSNTASETPNALPDGGESGAESFTVVLLLRLPKDYPDVIPEIDLIGLDEMFSEERIEMLIDDLKTIASENVGMPMVFTIVSSLQDHMGSLIEEKNLEALRKEERKKEEEEALTRKKFEGTRVTHESFMIWKKKFDEERIALKEKQNVQDAAALMGKLTGRQLFLRDATLSLSDVVLMQNDAVEIDESLFEEVNSFLSAILIDLGDLDIEDSDEEP